MDTRKLARLLLLSCVAADILSGCKKDDDPAPAATAACIPQRETTGLVGNESSWEHEYDGEGNPSKIREFNKYGSLVYTTEISSNTVIRTKAVSGSEYPTIIKTHYNSEFLKVLPSKAEVSITASGTELINWKTYSFHYDSKSRVIKIEERTNGIANDYEWDLIISYNDANNVTQLQYVWVVGPTDPVPPITVKAYDDKPTPYAGVKSWMFLMRNFSWDNADPEPVLTALSSNNPLDYTLASGANTWERTMSYQYNEHGFPVERSNTNKNFQGEYTFLQTFSYSCP